MRAGVTVAAHPQGMEVVVSGSSTELRVALVGELDEAAAAVVSAAAAVARNDRVTLLLDTSKAYPRPSPILERLEKALQAAAQRQPIVLR